jgi:hypothetical protein
MNQYQNEYMDICIVFPNNWSFRFWKNRKNELVNPSTHQSSFEDLPSPEVPQKILFSARARGLKGASMLGSGIEMVALYRPSEFNLESEIPIDCSEILRCIEKQYIAGRDATCLHIEKQGQGYIRYMRCYYWPYNSNIWLVCVVLGSSLVEFNEALAVLSGMQNIQNLNVG